MKSFIKDKVRLMLENKAKHTSANTPSGDADKIYHYTPETLRAEIANANKAYRANSEELGSVEQGDGLYEFALYQSSKTKFAFGGKITSFGSKEPGDSKLSKDGKVLYMYMMANSGIIHPEYELDKDDEGDHSPMSHAKIKVLFDFGPKIIDFVDGNVGYIDGKGHDIGADKMKDYEARKKDKKDLEMELGKTLNSFEWERYKESGQLPAKVNKKIEVDSDVAALTVEKQRLLALWKNDKRNKELRKQIKQIERLEKQISK